jgi:hypothetical protein
MLAERAAARGGIGAGGFDVDVERVAQQQAEAGQSFEAALMADKLQQQRQELIQGIQLAIGTGQQDLARQLQEKLGMTDIELRRYLGKGQLALGLFSTQLEAQLERERLAQQASQFGQSLGLQGRELDLRNQQFYDQLGFNYAGLQNQMNNAAIEALFG